MNYEQTIRQLKERRDFYAAAVHALEQIQTYETEKQERASQRPAVRRRIGKGVSAGWAKRRAAMDWTPVINTMHLPIREAAEVMGVSHQTVVNRRKVYAAIKPANGSAGEPTAIQ